MDRNNTTNILLKGIVILIVPAIAIVALGKIGLTEAQAIFIVGVFTVITAANQIRASNKKTFINTITIARKEYSAELRKAVTEFCVAAVRKDNEKLKELSYELKLLMNPADNDNEHWDREAIKMIDRIAQAEDKKEDIDKFITLMQSWLAIEWHGMRKEAKKGIMSGKDVKEIKNKEYKTLKEWIAKKYFN